LNKKTNLFGDSFFTSQQLRKTLPNAKNTQIIGLILNFFADCGIINKTKTKGNMK